MQLGCAAGRYEEARAVLTVRQATMQRHGAARDETGWLSIGTGGTGIGPVADGHDRRLSGGLRSSQDPRFTD